jgi:GGDEF domain-containing protein
MALALAPAFDKLRGRDDTGGRRIARLARSAWRAFAPGRAARRTGLAGRPCSLAVFDVGELPELRQLFGDRAAYHTVVAIRRALQRIDPVAGRVSRMTATSFAVLLPGYDEQAAIIAVRDALGEAPAIESDWHGEELVVVPDFLIRTLGDSPDCVDRLHRQLLGEIADRQQRLRRRLDYLRRERESHLSTSRPVLLSAA